MKRVFLLLLLLLSIGTVTAQAQAEHTVATGETLQTIASKYGLSVSDLKAANAGLDEYMFAGMVLKLPAKETQKEAGTQNVLPVDDLKDIIYLKDGSELVAKILTIETNEITFEQYDTDEPFVINKSDVASIRFEDGRVTDFTIQPKKTSTTKKKTTYKR